MDDKTALLRSWMFVPGDRQRMIDKALALPVDAILLDIEDGVAPAAKETARKQIAEQGRRLDAIKQQNDDLVARLDPKLDRTTMTLEIKGFWHEDGAPVKDAAFADALAKGLIRFAKFVEAKRADVGTIKPIALRREVNRAIVNSLDAE